MTTITKLHLDSLLDVFLATPLPDFLNLCMVNLNFKQACQDPYLWQQRVARDFSIYQKPSDVEWQDVYLSLLTDIPKPVPLFLDGDDKGVLWISPQSTIKNITSQILKRLSIQDNMDNLGRYELVATFGSHKIKLGLIPGDILIPTLHSPRPISQIKVNDTSFDNISRIEVISRI
jgi:hypothetical protein